MCNGIRYHVKLSAETYKNIKVLTALSESKSISDAIEAAVADIYEKCIQEMMSA